MATEEQTAYDSEGYLDSTGWVRIGQKLTISNRTVSKLGLWLRKVGRPTGDITFTIRKVSDDSIITSKVWGNASGLSTSLAYKEVTFDSPVLINEEVRIAAEFSGGNADNTVRIGHKDGDVKADESYQQYATSWVNYATRDCAYIYTYTIPAVGFSRGYIIG